MNDEIKISNQNVKIYNYVRGVNLNGDVFGN